LVILKHARFFRTFKRCKSRFCGAEYTRNDELLNSYNATFILGWRANIDFRPVINKEAVIAYVAKYASKGESSSSSYQDTLQKPLVVFKTLMQQVLHIKKCFLHLLLNVTSLVKRLAIYFMDFL